MDGGQNSLAGSLDSEAKSGRGLPQSKTLSRDIQVRRPSGAMETDELAPGQGAD